MQVVGKKIRELRHAKEWSQEEVARRLGISIAAYSKIETGITDMNLSRLEQIGDLFGQTLTDILGTGSEELELTAVKRIAKINALISERDQDIMFLQKKVIELHGELKRARE